MRLNIYGGGKKARVRVEFDDHGEVDGDFNSHSMTLIVERETLADALFAAIETFETLRMQFIAELQRLGLASKPEPKGDPELAS